MNLEWAHAFAAIIGAVFGAVGSIFTGGWRLGRIESRLKLHFEQAVIESERRIETKLDDDRLAYDETLKGIRQKINDVEKDAILRYLPKEEFNDFRQEYREDTREIKALIAEIRSRGS